MLKTKEPVYGTKYATVRDVLAFLSMLGALASVIIIIYGAVKEYFDVLFYGVLLLVAVYIQYMVLKALFDIADHTWQTRDAVEQLRKEMKARPVPVPQSEPPKTNLGPTRYNPKTHEYEAI